MTSKQNLLPIFTFLTNHKHTLNENFQLSLFQSDKQPSKNNPEFWLLSDLQKIPCFQNLVIKTSPYTMKKILDNILDNKKIKNINTLDHIQPVSRGFKRKGITYVDIVDYRFSRLACWTLAQDNFTKNIFMNPDQDFESVWEKTNETNRVSARKKLQERESKLNSVIGHSMAQSEQHKPTYYKDLHQVFNNALLTPYTITDLRKQKRLDSKPLADYMTVDLLNRKIALIDDVLNYYYQFASTTQTIPGINQLGPTMVSTARKYNISHIPEFITKKSIQMVCAEQKNRVREFIQKYTHCDFSK